MLGIFLWLALGPLRVPAQTAATSMPLLLPSAIAYDAAGNLYIAETTHHVIRRVDPSGAIRTIAGTGTQGFDGDNDTATSALLDSPQGLAASANALYIADTHNHRIRRVDLSSSTITTLAGTGVSGSTGDNGPAAFAMLDRPTALALDSKGNLYFADVSAHRIRRIDAATGIITTVAGAGVQGDSGDNAQAASALLDSPQGLAVDLSGNLYLSDTHNHRIRRIDATTGLITTVGGTGAFGYAGDSIAATSAKLAFPQGLAVDAAGNLYLSDTANQRIRRIDAATGLITTVAGDGTQGFRGDGDAPTAASLDSPRSITRSPTGLVTIADTANQRIRQATPATLQTIAGLSETTPPSPPSSLSLSGASATPYGSGTVTATLASATTATGSIVFLDTFAGTSGIRLAAVPLSANAAVLDLSSLPAGQHLIAAAYSSDSEHAPLTSDAFSLTVTPLPLTAILSPASLQYGETMPPLTGALNGLLPRDQSGVSATFSTIATANPSAGTYPVTVTLIGPAAGNYTLSSVPTLTITKASTATALTATTNAASSDVVQPVLLSAHVSSATTGVPTGTVFLFDGGSQLTAGTASASGDFSFSTSSLASGPHSLYASYSGDANFRPSTSSTTLFTIGGPPPTSGDFTLALSSTAAQTIVAGESANYTFTLQTQGSLSGPVVLAASGAPDLATVSFNPSSIPPGTPLATFTMTVATPKTSAFLVHAGQGIASAFLVVPLLCLWSRRGPRLLAIVLVLWILPLSGCGDRVYKGDATGSSPSGPSAPKTYTITVTGSSTDGSGKPIHHTAEVTLTVQPS
ncbi:MAG TPA: Ig-like domain repeat protein [Edaphobacter sp.]